MSDHYLEVVTETDFIERHVDLTLKDARRLRATLGELKAAGKIAHFALDGNAEEFYTRGYEDTLDTILDELRLKEES